MQTSNRFSFPRHFAVVVLASAVAIPVWAQQTQPSNSDSQQAQPAATDSQSTPTSTAQQPSPVTDHPLSQPKEGFWGRMNPFASKKWVKRETDPINDRLSELDDINARNARDIKDVDARAQAGITKAQTSAAPYSVMRLASTKLILREMLNSPVPYLLQTRCSAALTSVRRRYSPT